MQPRHCNGRARNNRTTSPRTATKHQHSQEAALGRHSLHNEALVAHRRVNIELVECNVPFAALRLDNIGGTAQGVLSSSNAGNNWCHDECWELAHAMDVHAVAMRMIVRAVAMHGVARGS